MPTDYEDKPLLVNPHELVVAPIEDVVKVRDTLIAQVHKEDNSSKKLDKIADVVDVVFLLSEKIYKDNIERHKEAMEKLDKNYVFFAAEFKSISSRLDALAKQQDTQNSLLREELHISMTEIREKLAALLPKT